MRQAWTRSPFISVTLVLSATVVSGCGVNDAAKGLFAPDGEAGAGGAATTSSSSASSGHGGETSTTSTSSGSQGGAGGGDPTSTSSSTGGPAPTLDCVDATCAQGENSACCYHGVSDQTGECIDGPASNDTCNTEPTQDAFGSRIECQLPSHCGDGQICCGTRRTFGMRNAYYPTVQCQSDCAFPDVQLCDPASPDCPIETTPQGTKVQTVCRQSERLPPNYFICARPPMP